MKKHWLLDPGHGGLVNGEYVTPGKRSPKWPDGRQYFEGVGNRAIVQGIASLLKDLDINHTILVEEEQDIKLSERVARANYFHKKYPNAVLLSIHSNGADSPQAHGWEVFTSVGQTKSDQIAETFFDEAKDYWPKEKFRADKSDGDKDKEAQFYVLKHSSCPAILTENFFHTNEKDCKFLLSHKGQNEIINMHVSAILRVEQHPML